MYAGFKVKIPMDKGKITQKKIKGTVYVYYVLGRVYNLQKQYSEPKTTTIGKTCEDDPGMMYPDNKFYVYYPDVRPPEEDAGSVRSGCLRMNWWS